MKHSSFGVLKGLRKIRNSLRWHVAGESALLCRRIGRGEKTLPAPRALALQAVRNRATPSRRSGKCPHAKRLYRQRQKTGNMLGRLKDRRHIHACYDRCAHGSFSAICIEAAVAINEF